MRLIDKAKRVLVTLVIALSLLCSITQMEGPLLPASPQSEQQQSQVFNQVSDCDDGIIKFVGSHQNHLLRLEPSLRSDNQPTAWSTS